MVFVYKPGVHVLNPLPHLEAIVNSIQRFGEGEKERWREKNKWRERQSDGEAAAEDEEEERKCSVSTGWRQSAQTSDPKSD